jgi:hypothetical protein
MSAKVVNLVKTLKESDVISTSLYNKFHFFYTEVENCLSLGHAEIYTNYRLSWLAIIIYF